MFHLLELLQEHIPTDHCRQVSAWGLAESLIARHPHIRQVMDLGCGDGSTCEPFRALRPDLTWVGLDIRLSREAAARSGPGREFQTYDGAHMPFVDGRFDLVFSRQVFEHVRYPEIVLAETCRVLRPGGLFVCSTSHLEPYHSHSVWNYTPYGFALLLETAGLELIELRPGIDALTLIIRRGLGSPKFFARWWEKESPLNRAIGLAGRLVRKNTQWINGAKLLFCGQFVLVARKPGGRDALSRR